MSLFITEVGIDVDCKIQTLPIDNVVIFVVAVIVVADDDRCIVCCDVDVGAIDK